MTRKKICWITPDYYLCVDPFIVPHLTEEFDIDWIVVNARNTGRKTDGLVWGGTRPREFQLHYRQKDPRIISEYLKLLKEIRRSDYDLIYISFHGFPYFFPLFLRYCDPARVIWGVHNVNTPKGASNEYWMARYQNYAFRRLQYFHVFSRYQLNVIKQMVPGKHHYYAPLTLEDYGPSHAEPPLDNIRFLFFGYIKEYKKLDLLIRSFLNLRRSGIGNVELYIAGNCANWPFYESLIGNESSVISRIEIIPNRDIPDLVSSCHYMVLPYKDGAQSAVLTLAYQYNKPVIVSDIESFKQYVIDGHTGFVFENGSEESLTQVMKHVVHQHRTGYPGLKNNIREFCEREFALDQIVSKYRAFLNDCMAGR